MVKHCETLDHTADVGLLARADTLGELFEALAEGLCDVICLRGSVAPARRRKVAVDAEDTEALAVDFLNEVLWQLQTEHFAVASVEVRQISETAMAAELAGEPFDPKRHETRTEIKAVTYHELKVAREGDGWIGRVILDL